MRISQEKRGKIVKIIMRDTFQQRKEAIKKAENDIALELYNLGIPENERNIMKKFPHMFSTSCWVYAVQKQPNYVRTPFELASSLPTYPQAKSSFLRFTEEIPAELEAKITDYLNDMGSLNNNQDVVRYDLHSFFGVFNTRKQLLEAWPDLYERYPEVKEVLGENYKVPAVVDATQIKERLKKAKEMK